MGKRTWPDDRKAELSRRWMSGESYGTIAEAMGVSRGAVSSKVSRLKLKRPLSAPTVQISYPQRAKAAKPVRRAPTPIHKPNGTPIALEGLARCQCRYSTGMVANGEWGFCGVETDGGPWCEHHKRIVWVKAA